MTLLARALPRGAPPPLARPRPSLLGPFVRTFTPLALFDPGARWVPTFSYPHQDLPHSFAARPPAGATTAAPSPFEPSSVPPPALRLCRHRP
jgi:hypothetical protein